VRVLLLAPNLPPHLGGVEAYVYGLTRGLTGAGCDVHVLTAGSERSSTAEAAAVVHRIPHRWTLSNTPVDSRWRRWFRELVADLRPDVVNAHTPVPFLADVAAWHRRCPPLVITYHATSLLKADRLANVGVRSYLALERFSLNRAQALIGASPLVTAALQARGVRPPVHTVGNSVWVDEGTMAGPLPVCPRKPSFELVFVAALDRTHRWKGLRHILEAMRLDAEAPGGGRPMHLTVVGDGDDRTASESWVREHGVVPRVSFTGALHGADKDRVIARADALLSYPNTSNDAFPTVFLEAWAQGTAVVTSSVEPMTSILEDDVTAVLAPPAAPAKLLARLRALEGSPQVLGELAANGRALLLRDHSWAKNTAKTLAVLRAASSGVAAGPPAR